MRHFFCVATAALLASCTAPTESEPPAPASVAAAVRRFLEVEGPVTLDGQPAAVGMAIGEASRLETAKGGRALITVQPGSVIEVREGSRLQLGSSTRRKTSIQLLSGILWSILPPGKADYEVVTANAVAGVRGTTFFVDASAEDHTTLCLCQGEISLDPTGAEHQELQTGSDVHTGYLLHKDGGTAAKVERMGTLPDSDSHPNARREQLRAMAPQ